jgi:hypothetical protein
VKFLAIWICVLGLTILPANAEARIFDLGRESFASYLLITHGPSSRIADSAFADESSATTFSDSVTTNVSGEFGFVYAVQAVSWRFGFEIFKPAALADVTAKDGSTTRYVLSSDVVAYMPKIGLELNFLTASNYRLFLFGYFGQGSATITNTYSSVTISPNSAFTSKYKGNASAKGGGLGAELAAFDTTSIVVEVGYRMMAFTDLIYSADVTDFSGAHTAGDTVRKTDQSKREMDFSGAYASFGARWWLF